MVSHCYGKPRHNTRVIQGQFLFFFIFPTLRLSLISQHIYILAKQSERDIMVHVDVGVLLFHTE